MKTAVGATIAVAVLLGAFLLAHRHAVAERDRLLAAASSAGVPADPDSVLTPYLDFLAKFDHFLANYGYFFIPLFWIVAFTALKHAAKPANPSVE